jgi:hypothetical protein
MDFDLSRPQRDRLDSLNRVVEEAGTAADIDQLDKALLASDMLQGASVLDRYMIAEELSRRGLASAFGLYALVCDLLPDGIPSGRVAIVESSRNGPVRFADSASVLVVLDADRAYLHDQSTITHRPAPTRRAGYCPTATQNASAPVGGWRLPPRSPETPARPSPRPRTTSRQGGNSVAHWRHSRLCATASPTPPCPPRRQAGSDAGPPSSSTREPFCVQPGMHQIRRPAWYPNWCRCAGHAVSPSSLVCRCSR